MPAAKSTSCKIKLPGLLLTTSVGHPFIQTFFPLEYRAELTLAVPKHCQFFCLSFNRQQTPDARIKKKRGYVRDHPSFGRQIFQFTRFLGYDEHRQASSRIPKSSSQQK